MCKQSTKKAKEEKKKRNIVRTANLDVFQVFQSKDGIR